MPKLCFLTWRRIHFGFLQLNGPSNGQLHHWAILLPEEGGDLLTEFNLRILLGIIKGKLWINKNGFKHIGWYN
jgi:hypothetical protein